MLILVLGLPGAGKSTVARLLAEALGAETLNSDVVRRELFPVTRTYTSQETGAVIKETERRITELLKEGKTVVTDALFTKERSRDEYRQLAQELQVPFVLIYVSAPETMTKERMDQRSHAGDASEATFEYYLNRKPHFEVPSGEHYHIENDGSMEELQQKVGEVARKLRDGREIRPKKV